jgi:hypothetical protein
MFLQLTVGFKHKYSNKFKTWRNLLQQISLKCIYLFNMLCLVIPEYVTLHSHHHENQKFEVMDILVLKRLGIF